MSWPVAVALASAFLNAVIGSSAYLRSRAHGSAVQPGASLYRSLAFLSFSFSFWSVAYLRCWPDFEDPFWARMLFTPLAWLPGAVLSFISSYIGVPDSTRRWRCWPLYGLAIAALGLLWTGRITLDRFRVGFAVLAFPIFIAAIARLFLHWRRAEEADERNRRGYLFAASLIAVAGGVTDFVPLGAPLLPLANPALTAYSLLVLMAIEKHHLMDLGEAARQAAVLLGISLGSAAFLSVLAWVTRQVEGQLFLNFFVLSLALLVAIPPIWERVNRAFTRWMFSQQTRRDRAIAELEEGLESVREAAAIAGRAAGLVREVWGASSELLWAPRALRGLEGGPLLPETLRRAFAADPSPVTAAALRRLGPLGDAALLEALAVREAEAAVPVTRDGELVGALLIGKPAIGFFDLAALRSMRRLGAALGRAVRNAETAAGLLHADRLAQIGTLSAGIAHEIRNPLSSILGAVELLQMPIPEKDRGEYLEILQREVIRLDGTLKELLDYASAQPKRGTADWLEVWGRVEKLIRLKLPESVVLEASREPAVLAVSGAHLQQILLNLVKNAIRAAQLEGADAPPAVKVELALDGGRAELSVEDNGPGIPGEMRARLFSPFSTASVGGTGLGLATVRRLAELYGGRAWADDRPKGARFVVELPLAARNGEAK